MKDQWSIITGNARVGFQVSRVEGVIVSHGGGEVTVNGFEMTPAGTFLVDGVSVGTPARSGCGCPGADTFHFKADQRICSRCGNPLD